MKVLCKHCENLCKKFGKIDCDDYKKTSADDLEKQRNALLLSQDTPELLKEIQKKILYFEYGIII